jgi:hypothetical protein
VRPPGAAGNGPSRHTTVYRCRIEGRGEAGLMIETSFFLKKEDNLKSKERKNNNKKKKHQIDTKKKRE